MKKLGVRILVILAMLSTSLSVSAASLAATIGVNVLLNKDIDASVLKELGSLGTVLNVIKEVDGLTMRIKASQLSKIQALPYVLAASPDAERNGAPIDTVDATDFCSG